MQIHRHSQTLSHTFTHARTLPQACALQECRPTKVAREPPRGIAHRRMGHACSAARIIGSVPDDEHATVTNAAHHNPARQGTTKQHGEPVSRRLNTTCPPAGSQTRPAARPWDGGKPMGSCRCCLACVSRGGRQDKCAQHRSIHTQRPSKAVSRPPRKKA